MGRKHGIFPCLWGEELESTLVESSEFFQVPGHLYYIRRLALLSLTSNIWGYAQNFPKSHSLNGGRGWNFSKSHSLYGVKRPPQILALPKPTFISLQKELGAYMEETVRRVTSRTEQRYQRLYGGRTWNLFKSHSLYDIWGEKLEFFKVPTSLGGSLGSEFFQVPETIWTIKWNPKRISFFICEIVIHENTFNKLLRL